MNYARFGSIYVATNMVTEEQYVGQTQQPLKTRVYSHMISALKPKFRFARAIAEYGFENFMFAEVAVAFDRDALNDIECAVIADLAPAYNVTKGGSGRRGPTSEATRTKRSDAARQRWADPEWRARTTASIQKAAAEGKFDASGARLGALGVGSKVRWAGHTKREKPLIARRVKRLRLLRPRVEGHRQMAASKYKPVVCPELGISFLAQNFAAEHLGVCKAAVSAAVKRKGKVSGCYTLVRV